MINKINTVLFDLDGTLLDTAPDLATALNIVLQQNSRPTLSFAKIRSYSSTGTRGLLNLGFQITEDDPKYTNLREQFLHAYHQHLNDGTKIFPGIDAVLQHIEINNMHWGVVTNKPQHLAQQLLQYFNLLDRCACIIGGDTLPKRKPDPEPLLHACKLIGCNTSECVYVGDAERDIEAAKRANICSIAALYGYINELENPQTWNADYYIKQPHQILNCLHPTH
jgi:phosphoglycolate phosphatase